MMQRFLIAALALLSFPAFAAEEGGAAVPQFDPSSYAGQLFWLVITFAVLYVLMARIALPRVGFVVEQRTQRIEQDVSEARSAADAANSLQAEVEAHLAEARSQARETLSVATATAAAQQTATLSTQNTQLVARLQEAEANIAKARTTAMASITPAAVATAASVLHKLAGIDAKGDQLASAIDQALKQGA